MGTTQCVADHIPYRTDLEEDAFNKKEWDDVVSYTSENISDIHTNALPTSIRTSAYAYKGMLNVKILLSIISRNHHLSLHAALKDL